MELRAFAEQVLFARSLREKLACPEELTDDHPGVPIQAPSMPGRPNNLSFKSKDSDASAPSFPKLHALEKIEERGRLLHFFANHELLATELMALVLLRFPQAPPEFRKGVLRTLKDEQEHTLEYMRRIEACGVQFGDLPVSGYFWRSVASMENPIDYVTRLSLTFEQANLDFCQVFQRAFATVGDAPTAGLLERIYRDEIHHVAYGLKWFRRWKHPTDSDWQAFCKQLQFPLSPQRAKGTTFNAAGRRAAGLDEEFINQMRVFAQSKGRTPAVFWFNPLSEGGMAQGPSFTPAKAQAALVADLECLAGFLARRDDVVLVTQMPSLAWRRRIAEVGFPQVEFQTLDSGTIPVALHERKLSTLRPWAWGPDSARLLTSLSHALPAGEPDPTPFTAQRQTLYSKVWSARFLRAWMEDLTMRPAVDDPIPDWLCETDVIGTSATSPAEVLDSVYRIRARGHHRVVLKAEFGLAGQSAVRLWEPTLLPAQKRWIEQTCERGLRIVVEPWLDRIADFSVQFELQSGRLRRIGFTGLVNDHRGQFCANWAAADFRRSLPIHGVDAFRGRAGALQGLPQLFDQLQQRLESELVQAGHVGALGVDCFVYRDANGFCRVKPVVEINPRYTMGRLTLELMRQVSPGSCGWFEICRVKSAESSTVLANEWEQQLPLVMEGDPSPRIRQGALVLNDIDSNPSTLALFRVAPGVASLRQWLAARNVPPSIS